MGTDGLWAAISPERAMTLIAGIRDPAAASLLLVQKAYDRRTIANLPLDDITCTVVDFNDNRSAEEEVDLSELFGLTGRGHGLVNLNDGPAKGCCRIA